MKQLIEHPKDFISEQFFSGEVKKQSLPLMIELFYERRNDLLKESADRAPKIPFSLQSDGVQLGIRKSPWKCMRMSRLFKSLNKPTIENTLNLDDRLAPHWSLRLDSLSIQSENEKNIQWVKPRSLYAEEKNIHVHYRVLPALFFDLYFSFLKMKTEGNSFGVILSQIQSASEARFLSDLLFWLEDVFQIKRGSTEVSIEFDSITGCREAEEIIFELKDRATSLSFDVHGYSFSYLKCFGAFPENVFFAHSEEALWDWVKPLLSYLSNISEKRNLMFLPVLHSLHPFPQEMLKAPSNEMIPGKIEVTLMIQSSLNYLRNLFNGEIDFKHSQFEYYRSLLWQWNRFNLLNIREIFEETISKRNDDSEMKPEEKCFQVFLLKESLIEDSIPHLFKYLKIS